MWAGTGTPVTFASTTAVGSYILNVRTGTIHGFKDLVDESSESVAGSLPNTDMFLGATSNNGTAQDFADRDIGSAFIYDGFLEEAGVAVIEGALRLWARQNNR